MVLNGFVANGRRRARKAYKPSPPVSPKATGPPAAPPPAALGSAVSRMVVPKRFVGASVINVGGQGAELAHGGEKRAPSCGAAGFEERGGRQKKTNHFD